MGAIEVVREKGRVLRVARVRDQPNSESDWIIEAMIFYFA